MARRYFGTDGVRGVANSELSCDLALALGRAAARFATQREAHRPAIIVGRDTRRSGTMLEDALCAGIASAGATARRAGVIPTPAVAWLVRDQAADLGVVISASHNPYPDNGIKLFGRDGFKLSDDDEQQVEALLDDPFDPPTGYGVGASDPVIDAADRYAAYVAATSGRLAQDLRLVMDCAHGAASDVAGRLFDQLGVDYSLIGAEPNGVNINVRCGSTHLDHVASAVHSGGFDLGLAVDGDADRVLAVDASGAVIDGDHILAILARDLRRQGLLDNDLVVVTSMANLGLRRALATLGCRIVVTDVGDRYVLEAMRREGAVLGGEQSGHVISLRHTTTGDGLLTAASLLAALDRASESLTDAAALVTKYPQELVSVRADRTRLDEAERVWAAVRASEAALGDDGRVVLRASGTEPLVRVMVEASDRATCARHVAALVEVVEAELGLD